MTTSTTKNKAILLLNKVLKFILPLLFILLIWEIISRFIDNEFFMPNIKSTWLALINIVSAKGFFKIVSTAIIRVIKGIIIGLISGFFLATCCHFSSIVSAILSPIISIMKATPVACIIVLLWISMNNSNLAIFVVVIMVTPIIWQNVLEGYESVDKGLNEVAEVFEFSALKKFKLLILPTLKSYIIPALITSIGLAWKAEVAAEIMTNNNIGKLIYDLKTLTYDTASIFAWTVIIVILSIVFEKTSKYLLRRFL